MAVSTAATASVTFGGSVSSASFSIAIVSTNDYVLIGVGVWTGAPSGMTSVSVGTTSLAATLIASNRGSTAAGGNEAELWLFPARLGTTGTKTVNCVASGIATGGVVGAVVLTGVDSTSPQGTGVLSSGKSSATSVTVGSSANDIVFGALAWDASVGTAGISTGASEKLVAGSTVAGEGGGFLYELGITGNVSLTPRIANSSSLWNMVGINIHSSTSGAAPPILRPLFTMLGAGR
jgi:hypothetical protein